MVLGDDDAALCLASGGEQRFCVYGLDGVAVDDASLDSFGAQDFGRLECFMKGNPRPL